MTSLKDKLDSLTLIERSSYLKEILDCFTEYLSFERKGIIEFEESDIITILPDKVKYFEEIADGSFKSKEFDIEDFMSMIYSMLKAAISELDEELARLDKSDHVMDKIDVIFIEATKSSLKLSLGEFEAAYGRSDIYGIIRSL